MSAETPERPAPDEKPEPAEGPLPEGFPDLKVQINGPVRIAKKLRVYEEWTAQRIAMWRNGTLPEGTLSGLKETISWILAMKEELSGSVVVLPEDYYAVMLADEQEAA